jgi:superfamily II DNA or RNA helicase
VELREHQNKAIQLCRESIKQGHKRIMLAAPCSFGKTRVAVEMLASAAKKGLTGLFICDRIKLVQQAILMSSTSMALRRESSKGGIIQGRSGTPRSRSHQFKP